MSNIIRIPGAIKQAHILWPREDWGSGRYVHELFIEPCHPHWYTTIEHLSDQAKRKVEKFMADNPDVEEPFNDHEPLVHKDTIKFKSLNRPQITGELSNAVSDDELLYKSVTAVGSLDVMKDGNTILSLMAIDGDPYLYERKVAQESASFSDSMFN